MYMSNIKIKSSRNRVFGFGVYINFYHDFCLYIRKKHLFMKFAFKVHDEKYIILELVEPTPVEGPPADKPADICPTGEYGLVSHQIKRKLGKYLIR